jgi:hypothetical protein
LSQGNGGCSFGRLGRLSRGQGGGHVRVVILFLLLKLGYLGTGGRYSGLKFGGLGCSQGFCGAQGRAGLFSDLLNISYSPYAERQLPKKHKKR